MDLELYEVYGWVNNLNPLGEAAKATRDLLKCWEIAGVKYAEHPSAPKSSELLDELAVSVERTLKQYGTQIHGCNRVCVCTNLA
jgi:hypothetical protein